MTLSSNFTHMPIIVDIENKLYLDYSTIRIIDPQQQIPNKRDV